MKMNLTIISIFILVFVTIIAFAFLVLENKKGKQEGFRDVDLLQTQRQQLQWEGERRYNPVARLQDPSQKIPADQMNSALTTTLARPVQSADPTFLGLIGSSLGLGAADDGSGKSGAWVEQTGILQDKINFCESLTTIDCDKLGPNADPRMRECGFCHRDGVNSKGKAHRGGMFISSDDQIRANEKATATGEAASYVPTIGTCRPENFTQMPENCQAREAQLQCQSAGFPSAKNACAQCYGKTPSNATGLLFFNPTKPYRHQVFLNASHSGYYTGPNGFGLEITYPNGSRVGLPAVPAGNRDVVQPLTPPLQLTLAEGDVISVTIYGPPPIWCGWLSNQSGTRTVSLDVGVQSMTPESALEIAGDKNSSPVQSIVSSSAAWNTFQTTIPNTVLWYMRRNDVITPSIVQALYGSSQTTTTNATESLQTIASQGKEQVVGPSTILTNGLTDPAPGQPKAVWASFDNGSSMMYPDGKTLDWSDWITKVTFTFQMPATLADPPFPADQADCPTGPLVTTEVGAGLMGSHSCFKPDGTFNPTLYCLQELFMSAGGTQQGTDYPTNNETAAKLVAPSGSLDDTVAALNRLGSIAQYGVDLTGATVDFATYKDAAQRMLGISAQNPCDGPTSTTGPHSPECLDYLWRTMKNPAADSVVMTTLPSYSGCSANGYAAPLNPDGTVNTANVASINANTAGGGVSAVRAYFMNLFGRTQNTSDFGDQVAAMRDCFGTNIQPPVPPTSSCPPPAPNDWQCFTPDKLQKPEVFAVCPDGGYTVDSNSAEGICSSYGARLASPQEIQDAQEQGAQWCQCAWASDGNAYFPMQQSMPGCGTSGVNSCNTMQNGWEAVPGKACVTCFGLKPSQGTTDILSASSATNQWSLSSSQSQSISSIIDSQHIPACRSAGGQIECVSEDGTNPFLFASSDACNAFVTGTPSSSSSTLTQKIPAPSAISSAIQNYIMARV